GSLWSGVCTALTVQRTPVGDVSWELHPGRLLLGELAAHIAVTHGAGNLDAEVELRFGQRVTVRQARADLPLDPALIPGLPAALHGRAHLDLALAQFEHGVITALQGRIEARDLEDRSGAATPPAGGRSPSPGRSDPLHLSARRLERGAPRPRAQAASTPFALAVCVAIRSISAGDRQS